MNRIILLLLAAGIATVLLLSPRGWSMANTPRIEEVATLPETAAVETALADTYPNMILPYLPGEAQARSAAALSRQRDRRLGYAYREVSIMKMPVWAYEEGGLVVYRELPAGYSVEPIAPEQVAALEKATGRTYSNHRLALLPHLWGWLFVAGFVLWWFVARRDEARRAERAESAETELESA
jgi:hypothetical protein